LLIVKDPEGVPVPRVSEHAGVLTGVPPIVQLLPAGRKPTPVTIMVNPIVPLDGVRVIVGPDRTRKMASAKSLVLPVMRIL